MEPPAHQAFQIFLVSMIAEAYWVKDSTTVY